MQVGHLFADLFCCRALVLLQLESTEGNGGVAHLQDHSLGAGESISHCLIFHCLGDK